VRSIRLAAITILLPGVVLVFFSARALMQEWRLWDQQIRENLQTAAEDAGGRLESEIREWQETVRQLRADNPANSAYWPERLRRIIENPSAGVVLVSAGRRIQSLPADRLLYELSPVEEEQESVSHLLADAESLELRENKYQEAAALYRRQLGAAGQRERPYILRGLARTLAKAGRTDEAIHAFKDLAKEPPVRIGSLPSDLLALYEIINLESEEKRAADALDFYRHLVAGRWRLEKPSYVFYSQQSRQWILQNEESRRLIAEEQHKLELSSTAEHFVEEPRSLYSGEGAVHVAFWRPQPFAAILLSEASVRALLLPAIKSSEFQFSLFGETPPQQHPVVTYTLQNAELPLRLSVWPQNRAALYAGARRQQNMYLGMLGVVVALLALGSYLIVRTMRSELAMAQMKAEFAATVSHEFRSPLTGINQLAEMLRDGRVPEERRRQEYYEMIVGETQRLRRLVDNILDFSRMEDGRKQYHFEPLEPAPWLRELAEDFQMEVAGQGFALEARIPKELPVVLADRSALATAVHNLLDNAVKYSRDSRIVWLEATADEKRLSISVRDQGVGIAERDQPRIFEKFYRGRELARSVKGVGLGLNLVQHIVAAHHGTIDFESKEGEGSTFRIRLNVERGRA
jgi:signal transduction histidine kinase